MTPIRPEPLTAAAFAPWGRVLEADPDAAQGINAGYTTRFHALAEIETEGAPPILSIFRGRVRPLAVDLLERHPHGSQAFMPLGGRPWLVVVADAPDARPRAFLARGDQGAQIGGGIWHAPLMPLMAQDFLVADRADPETNLETASLPEPISIAL